MTAASPTPTKPMNEAQRMHYLDAMGIDSYMPRFILPGARPSGVVAGSFSPVIPGSASGDIDKATIRTRAVEAPAETGATAVDTNSAAAVASTESGKRPAPEVKFCLSFWQVQDLLFVDSHEMAAALPTESLMNNILVALRLGPVSTHPEIFRWPLRSSMRDAGDEKSAREALSALFEARCDVKGVRRAVLMGAEACYFGMQTDIERSGDLSTQAVFSRQLGKTVALAGTTVDALVVPSLSEMLRNPALKPQAWRLLQVLQRSIRG